MSKFTHLSGFTCFESLKAKLLSAIIFFVFFRIFRLIRSLIYNIKRTNNK